MVVEDQRGVIEFLSAPRAYASVNDDGPPVDVVDRIETHSAVVFLAGTRAWKLKRAVRFDYLDFSTIERRRAMCEAEVRLNRRTAPSLYRGVVPVTRSPDGRLALNGSGAPVDWLVEMNRFDQRDLCDRRAADGTLALPTMERLATVIARFHDGAVVRRDCGGTDAMRWIIDGNAAAFATYAPVFDTAACVRLTSQSLAALRRQSELLEARRRTGSVRQCHGDLHLRNIVLLDGEPTLFDAVEFNDALSCSDVLYDLAFLLMDVLARGLPTHANLLFNRYLVERPDLDGLQLLPLFLSCRAAVRAKTSATAAAMQCDPLRRDELGALARMYLSLAEKLLSQAPAALIAIGGLSGTGKSTLATQIASEIGRAPGAVVLRSDEIRKRLHGVTRLTRLDASGYSAEVSARVYANLVEQAARVLRSGQSVVADAVFARPEHRSDIARGAAAAGVPFTGLWLAAPESVRLARVAGRVGDVSDADAQVIEAQLRVPIGNVSWASVDATRPAADVLAEARLHIARLPEPVPGH